ncbi:MAG: alpha/beta hydrolase domain-containing protein [Candidatus Glassbacteria bacterium]
MNRHFPRLPVLLALSAALVLLPLQGCSRRGERSGSAGTRVTGVEIDKRILLGEGVSFGAAGPYETLAGRVLYTLDPDDKANSRITDAAAAAGEDGLVHYSAQVVIVKPVNVERSNGALLYDVVNRGNFPTEVLDPAPWSEIAAGPTGARERMARLMKQGFTVVFSGWQADLEPGADRLRLDAPQAVRDGKPLAGDVLAEIETDRDTTTACLGAAGHLALPVDPARADQAVLREHETYADPGTVIGRGRWRFAVPGRDGGPESDSVHVWYEDGFRAHRLYTVVYRTGRSPAMGLCFPAVRELMGFLAGRDSLNPLLAADGTCPVRWKIAYGSSQCGRFLRNFLYDGFNRAVDGGRVFDGMLPNVPGCRMGFFNYRHAQPSRAWGFYPNFDFPFTDLPAADPVTGVSDGILASVPESFQPKIVYIHHAGEYWSSGAALTHVSLDGTRDVPLPPNVRIYTIAGTAHGNAPLEDGHPRATAEYRLPFNPNPPYLIEDPLLDALCRWVMYDDQPPPSCYPRVDRGELTALETFSFPAVPDVDAPVLVQLHPRFDWGKRWRQGIIDKPLPGIGTPYPTFVPAVGADGNELGGIQTPHVAVPLASYIGWNYYAAVYNGAANTLAAGLSGAWLPFCAGRKERQARGDSRKSLEELYRGRGDYLDRLRKAADKLVDQKLMFAEDVGLVLEQGAAMYDYVAANGSWKPEAAAAGGGN